MTGSNNVPLVREQFVQRYVIAQMAQQPDHARTLQNLKAIIEEGRAVYDETKRIMLEWHD